MSYTELNSIQLPNVLIEVGKYYFITDNDGDRLHGKYRVKAIREFPNETVVYIQQGKIHSKVIVQTKINILGLVLAEFN